MADKMNADYWSRFYGGADMDPSIPANTPAGELTTRPVKTVAIDPFTGQPIAAGGNTPAPATVAAMTRGNIQPKWADPSILRFPQVAGGDRLTGDDGPPLNTSGGQYGAGNPMVLAALTAQQSANPAVAAATAMASGGNIKPGWINQPAAGPRFPVAATPEIQSAYTAMVAGDPGAMDRYGKLLADQAGAGNIRISSGSGGGGSSSGGSSSSYVPAGQPVKIATGKTATSGQTYQQGANGAGKPYTYQVQPNGSIKNLTTGRITAPATR